jgi:hypothetical protein
MLRIWRIAIERRESRPAGYPQPAGIVLVVDKDSDMQLPSVTGPELAGRLQRRKAAIACSLHVRFR